MSPPLLLAVPNVSEGRERKTIGAIARAFAGNEGQRDGVRLLDVHSDPDHDRSVFTLAGPPGALSGALIAGARVAVERLDIVGEGVATQSRPRQHPHVGAVDVVSIVHLDEQTRGAACAEALVVADRIGDELRVPVFLYGELTENGPTPGRTRALLRRGGVGELARRMRADGGDPSAGLVPDFGPSALHPSAGATLVGARGPLVAFNLQLAPPASAADARALAAVIREGGAEGLPGVRAIGIELGGGAAQLSMNIERPAEVPLAEVVAVVRRHASVVRAELVGLAPRAALEGFPRDLAMPGFDPARHVVENALGF